MNQYSVSVCSFAPKWVSIFPPYHFAVITMALTLHLGCYGASGSIILDGKQLSSNAENITLDGGQHTLTGIGSGVVQYAGSISGPGELRVALPQSVTLQFEGEVSQVRLLVESGTVDLTKAVDRSGNATVSGTGILKRLANPIDISSSLRLWLDSSRVWTLFQDSTRVSPVTIASQEVGFWQSLDRWRGVAANNERAYGVIYAGPDGGVRFIGGSLYLPDIELRNEYTLGAVLRPLSLVVNNSACILTGWASIGSDQSLCYHSSVDIPNSRLLVGYNSGRWYYLRSDLYDMIVDGTVNKFSAEASIDTLVTAIGDSLGATLQFSGQQVASGTIPFITRDDARFTYYIGRRWDANEYLNMDLNELVVASDSKVADALNGYLAWHNGLQSKLDSSHPYKSCLLYTSLHWGGVYYEC